MSEVAFGIGTFGDVTAGPDGPTSHAQVIRDVVEEAVLADQVGVDAFALGEHHRDDFAVTAPEIVLAAAAARTSRILLASGVTVLSSDDPVRVFERFSTLDALSNGRAEVQLGRGSFTESFPLFGLDLARLRRAVQRRSSISSRALREGGPVTWEGTVRASLTDQEVFPRLAHAPLRTWVGVGRQPRVRGPHRPLRPADDAGDHRRRARAVRAVRRALPPGARPAGAAGAADRRPLARAHRRDGRVGAGRVLRRLQGDARRASAASAAGRALGRESSSTRSSTARSTSAPPRRSRGRSRRRSARSASSAST